MSNIKQKAAEAVARLAERTAARGKGDFDPTGLPVTGVEQARKVIDPTLPANGLLAA